MIPVLRRDGPLAQGLMFVIVNGWPRDLVTGEKGTAIGSATPAGRTKWGRAFESNSTSADGWWWPGSNIRTIGNKVSIVMCVDIDSDGGDGSNLISVDYRADGSFTTPYTIFNLNSGFGSRPRISLDFTKVTPTRDFDEQTVVWSTDPVAAVFGHTHDNGAGRFYSNGVAAGSTSAVTSGYFDKGTYKHIDIFTRSKDSLGSDGVNGRIAYAAVWKRPLSAGEHALLAADPMRIIAAKGSPVTFGPFPVAGTLAAAPTPLAQGPVLVI